MPPSTPRAERGIYWGYRVRMADTFAAVFTESPFKVRGQLKGTTLDEVMGPFPTRGVCKGGGRVGGTEGRGKGSYSKGMTKRLGHEGGL